MNQYALRTWMKGALLAAILLITAAPSARAERENCLKYEPFEVSLTGRIYSMIYPGGPHHESIDDGDHVTRVYFLIPDVPFCMVGNTEDALNVDTNDVDLVQFAPNIAGNWHTYMKKFYGRKVRLTGTLYCSAHDTHAPIDMAVKSIVIVDSK